MPTVSTYFYTHILVVYNEDHLLNSTPADKKFCNIFSYTISEY